MSIEQLIKENTEAINRNTEALLAVAGKAATTTAAAKTETTTSKTDAAKSGSTGGAKTSGAAKKEAAKPKHSEDEVVAALTKIKEEFGADPAKEIVKELGFAKMAEITPDKYDLAVELATKKYEALVEEAGGSGDSDDL